MVSIAAQFSELAQTYHRFLDIRARRDPDRKRDLVAARRDLSAQLAALEETVKTGQNGEIDPLVKREFGIRLSRLRTASAYHQASWPAVRIDEDPDGYQATSIDAANAFRDFLDWANREFSETSH